MKEKIYHDIPNYEERIQQMESKIRSMEKDRRYGGGSMFDMHCLKLDLERRHIFAKAQTLAKKQKKENVVQRLIRAAQSKKYMSRIDKKNNKMNRAAGTFWGVALAVGGAYASIPAVTVAGGAVALGCIAYFTCKNKVLKKANTGFYALKEYIETGNLDEAVQHAKAHKIEQNNR